MLTPSPRAAAFVIVALCELTPARSLAGALLDTRSGHRVHWIREEISLTVVPTSDRAPVSTELLTRELREASAIWNRALTETKAPRFRIEVDNRHRAVDRVGRNGQSVVIFQTARRCTGDIPNDVDCYERERSAITHVYPEDDGTVDEADIELNGVDVAWSVNADGRESLRLRAVLVHELGHVLGLEHSCDAPRDASALPSCSTAEAKTSLMYPDTLEAGRPLILEPGADERITLRETYGARSGCSCRTSRGEALPPAWTFLAISLWFMTRSRHRAQSAPARLRTRGPARASRSLRGAPSFGPARSSR